MSRLAIFRFDAGPSLGLGHAVRCGALAEALAASDWEIGLAVGPGTLAAMPRLSAAGYDVETLPVDDEPQALSTRWPDGCDLFVVDHYGRGVDFERATKPWARQVLALDDAPNRAHACDLLLDPAAHVETGTYEPWTIPGTVLLLGPQYALLRHAFRELREASLARRKVLRPLRRVMVGLGATDPADLTSRVVETVAAALPDMTIDIVLGAAAPHIGRVRDRIAGHARMRLLIDPPDVAEVMAAADLAVGAAGSTTFERACLGLPGIAVVAAANQESIARLLRERDAAIVVDGRTGDPAPAVAMALERLVREGAAVRRMSEAIASIADGRGGERVRLAVEARLAGRPSP